MKKMVKLPATCSFCSGPFKDFLYYRTDNKGRIKEHKGLFCSEECMDNAILSEIKTGAITSEHNIKTD